MSQLALRKLTIGLDAKKVIFVEIYFKSMMIRRINDEVESNELGSRKRWNTPELCTNMKKRLKFAEAIADFTTFKMS